MANFEWGSVTGSSEYGASRVPCSIKVHSFKNPWLTRWPLKRTSKDHLPLGYSAQGWVVIKGHLVNPSRESSSLGLLLKIRERVPMGDLRKSSTSPRRVELTVMTAWTCSK